MPAFKIWNMNRNQKYSIIIEENERIYQALISKGKDWYYISRFKLLNKKVIINNNEGIYINHSTYLSIVISLQL